MSQRALRRNRIVAEDAPGPSEPSEASSDDPADENEVPSFNVILQQAKKFSPAHQSLATLMVNMGAITKKKFYLCFIRDVVRIHFKKNPEIVSKIACSVDELDSLVSSLLGELNPRLSELGLRLTSFVDEGTGREMVVLVSEDVLPKDISGLSGFSADELMLFLRWIPQFVEGNGQLESTWALNEATKLPNPMTLVKAQNFVDRLVSDGWISEKGDIICLEPRAIAELEPLLTAKYGCSSCILCQKIVVRKNIAIICGSCDAQIHRHCWVKYSARSEGDDISCPGRGITGCDQMFSKSDVEECFS
ncbi:Phorbol-ester/DAG-type domain-containing protein [Trichostrongylus colubriformis]|uniref:Phorbol-ester/DAG-type domain-containing protein n=1 Tax=Trichostrongylus colubriformis TaxID=6319 RepID=A0AAN8FU48_TRICO